jgi:hypothetical protein
VLISIAKLSAATNSHQRRRPLYTLTACRDKSLEEKTYFDIRPKKTSRRQSSRWRNGNQTKNCGAKKASTSCLGFSHTARGLSRAMRLLNEKIRSVRAVQYKQERDEKYDG